MKKAVRLDKFLADAGAGTRSEGKKFIQKGKVQVNGVPAKKSEIKVSEEDEVVLDGNRISQAPEFVYYLLHKPAGYVSATEDKRDKTVMELVASDRKGLFPVGRLDKDTEGLLLITDDGALAHELLSPKKHVDKTYYAVTDGCMTKEDVQRFADGLEIGEKNPTMPAKLEILSTRKVEETELEQYPSGWSSEIQLTIKEGKFHQVKRMTEAVGKKVVYLKRISMGVFTLPDDLKKGECRPLTEKEVTELKESVKDLDVKILSGMEGLIAVATEPKAEIVVTAVVGMIGIRPTIAAMEAGKDIALANKETLVTAGHIIMPLAKKMGVKILPVDSEHSAIFQCLKGAAGNKIHKILLTASGGPFRGWKREQLEKVQVEDALKHPNWSMGHKITIDSSTMVNKGLEVMEAGWLFDVSLDQIQVVIQPASIIHSMIEYEDGAVIAQLGTPDMKLPIQYALYYPQR